jgi:hypothetical protein
MPRILATQEGEFRRLQGWKTAGANNSQDPILKKISSQKRIGGVAQGVGKKQKHNSKTSFWQSLGATGRTVDNGH